MLPLYVRTLDSSNDQLGETDQLADNIPTQIERIIRRSEGAKKKEEMTVSSCYHLECRLSPSTDQSEHDQRKKQGSNLLQCVSGSLLVHRLSAFFHLARIGNSELLSAGEVLAVAGQDANADIVALGGPLEGSAPLVVDLGVEGVVLFGAVEGDDRHAVRQQLDVECVEVGGDGHWNVRRDEGEL